MLVEHEKLSKRQCSVRVEQVYSAMLLDIEFAEKMRKDELYRWNAINKNWIQNITEHCVLSIGEMSHKIDNIERAKCQIISLTERIRQIERQEKINDDENFYMETFAE